MGNSSKTVFIFFFCIFVFPLLNAQETLSSAGGNATGSGGSISYTVGQVFYNSFSGETGSIAQGVQQPFEISLLLVTQKITLSEGWNILSFAAKPNDLSMRSIVDPLISEDILVKVQDEEGKAVERLSAGWINEIGQMSLTEGYKIRVTENTALAASGQLGSLPSDIPLEAGWNIIGYPAMNPQDASAIFNMLIADETLVKVQDELGGAIVKIEEAWDYGFDNLNSGEGYMVKVNAPATLKISSPGKGEILKAEKVSVKPVHFRPAYTGNGLDHMNIYIRRGEKEPPSLSPSQSYGGQGNLRWPEEGDEIAVFDGGVCVGAVVVDGTGNKYVRITASLDDPVTGKADGFTEGHPFAIRLWDSSSGMERKAQSIEPGIGYDKYFQRFGTSVLNASFEAVPRSFLEDAFPNPSTERSKFRFQLAGESRVRLEIFDVTGDLVKILVDETLQEGSYEVEWDNHISTGDKARAGIYFYKLSLNDLVRVKSLVIH